jgi:hypothetical protein
MWYEINVSKDGKHLFATSERSITDIITAKNMYQLFESKFPESEGYKITVSYCEHSSREIKL